MSELLRWTQASRNSGRNAPRWSRSGLFVLVAALFVPLAQAEITTDQVISFRGDAWSGDRNLTGGPALETTSLWGRLRIVDDDLGSVVGNGWLRAQTRQAGEPRHGLVRELYWRKKMGAFDLRVGRQQVLWGRADGFNPTDVLAPRDLRQLVPADVDQRSGNDGVTLGVALPVGSASLLWFPRTHSDTLPLRQVPGVSFVILPPRGATRAARWEFRNEGGGIDGSVSYVDGRDPRPDVAPLALSQSGLAVALQNQRLRLIGADMSAVRGDVVWRAELAATRTDSSGIADFTHKKSQFWFVGGPEWALPGGGTLGVEATWLHVRHFARPESLLPARPLTTLASYQLALSGQTSGDLVGAILRLAGRLRNDTVLLEANGVIVGGAGTTTSSLWRLRADVALDDRWHILAGADRYVGSVDTVFGQLRENSLAYLQLRLDF